MSSKDETSKKWLNLPLKNRDKIAKKYGYSTGRTIDRWVKEKIGGKIELLELILKEEFKMKNIKQIDNLIKMGLVEVDTMGSYIATIGNNEVHEALEDEVVCFKEIIGQDTYVFSDGSYITRLEDEYFLGDNIDMFEIEEELS